MVLDWRGRRYRTKAVWKIDHNPNIANPIAPNRADAKCLGMASINSLTKLNFMNYTRKYFGALAMQLKSLGAKTFQITIVKSYLVFTSISVV